MYVQLTKFPCSPTSCVLKPASCRAWEVQDVRFYTWRTAPVKAIYQGCKTICNKPQVRGSRQQRRLEPQRAISQTGQQVDNRDRHGQAKVVGMGLACWDYLAQVASFPEPDQKIRTLQLQVKQRSDTAWNLL